MVNTRLISQSKNVFASPNYGEYITIGDSIINGGYAGSSLARRVMFLSGGRFTHRRNFAVGGKRSDQILAEQVPLAIASGIKFAIINTGTTNDIAQSVVESVARANTIAIWNALRDAGIFFIDIGLLPNASAGAALRHVDHELWRRQYCARNGIPHVDAFTPLAAPTGAYVSGYGFDSLHPNSIAADLVAQKIIDVIDKPWSVSPLLELIDRTAGATVVAANAVSFGGTGSALPSAYFTSGTGATYSVQAPDSGQQNNWLRATFAASGSVAGFTGTARTQSTMGMNVGDRIAVGMLLRWSTTGATGMYPRVQLAGGFTDVITLPYDEYGNATGESIYAYGEYTATNSPTTAQLNFLATPSVAGYFEVSRPIIYNLTTNGLS